MRGLVRVAFQVFQARRTLAESCRAVLLAVAQRDAFALRHLAEVPVANIHAVDFEALAVLPGVPDLEIAEP